MLDMAAFSVVRGMSQVLKGHWKILKAVLPPQLQARRVAVYLTLTVSKEEALVSRLLEEHTYGWNVPFSRGHG